MPLGALGQHAGEAGALNGLTSTIVVIAVGAARVFFSMSGMVLLPAYLERFIPSFRTLGFQTLTVGIFVAVLAASFANQWCR